MSTETFTGSVNVGAFDKAAKSLVEDYVRQALEHIAEKYNFSAEEALRDLNMDKMSMSRSSTKKTPKVNKPSIPLPWTGVVSDESCRGLRLNHGLYTQCSGGRGESGFCKSCDKQCATNSSGTPNCGTVEDRAAVGVLEFTDPKGRLVVPYANVMKKLNISKEKVTEEAEKFGLEIPDEQFVERAPTRGRKKKDVAVDDTDDESSDKKRGRPKKDKKEVVSNPGDDLIATLVANVQAEDEETGAEKKEAKRLAAEERKAAADLKKAEKEAKKVATELKKKEAAEKKAALDAEKAAKKAARDEAALLKKAENEVKRAAIEQRKKEAAEKKALKDAEKEAKSLAFAQKKKDAAEKKAALLAEKEANRLEREAAATLKKAEKEAKRLLAEEKKKEREAKKAEKDAAKAEKEAKKAEKDALKTTKEDLENHIVEAQEELEIEPIVADEDEDEDDDATAVSEFEHNGVTYLKTEDNVLYTKAQELVGIWNEEDGTIEEAEEEED